MRDETQVQFKAELNKFEFKVFLLLHRWPYQGWRANAALLFTHRENYWIHTFSHGIIDMGNGNILLQELVKVSISYDDSHHSMAH